MLSWNVSQDSIHIDLLQQMGINLIQTDVVYIAIQWCGKILHASSWKEFDINYSYSLCMQLYVCEGSECKSRMFKLQS